MLWAGRDLPTGEHVMDQRHEVGYVGNRAVTVNIEIARTSGGRAAVEHVSHHMYQVAYVRTKSVAVAVAPQLTTADVSHAIAIAVSLIGISKMSAVVTGITHTISVRVGGTRPIEAGAVVFR